MFESLNFDPKVNVFYDALHFFIQRYVPKYKFWIYTYPL